MNKEKQRIAIAEACGWTKCHANDSFYKGTRHYIQGTQPKGTINSVPDYLNDLNAMHEAEKVLNPSQQQSYTWEMTGTVPDHDPDTLEGDWLTHTATAAQRAEAFLKTLNLWT